MNDDLIHPHPQQMGRRGLLGLGASLALGGLVSAQDAPPAGQPAKPAGPLLVYAVRHAEKAKDGTFDPPLSAAGKARAKELARILGDVPLDAVYSTNTIRTRTTGEVIAARKKLAISTYRPGRLAAQLKGTSGTVLVIGHSNTVPILIRGLGASFPVRFLSGYDDLYLTVVAGGQALLQPLHYGAADGATAAEHHGPPASKPAKPASQPAKGQ